MRVEVLLGFFLLFLKIPEFPGESKPGSGKTYKRPPRFRGASARKISCACMISCMRCSYVAMSWWFWGGFSQQPSHREPTNNQPFGLSRHLWTHPTDIPAPQGSILHLWEAFWSKRKWWLAGHPSAGPPVPLKQPWRPPCSLQVVKQLCAAQ